MVQDKENLAVRRSYATAALQRKQVAAASSNNTAAPLPRVAALAASSVRASQQRSPLRHGTSARPTSSLMGSTAQPLPRPPSASAHRMGCKPATHSTRSLVPLMDAMARHAPTPSSVASRTAAPAAASTPAPCSAISSVIGDPGLDSAEEALQAELALADRRLEQLHQQHTHRRSESPEAPGPEPAGPALSVGAPTPPLLRQAVLQQQHQLEHHHQLEQQHQLLLKQNDLMPSPSPEQQEPLPIPLEDQSIVRSITTATGTGCKDVLAAHTSAQLAPGACWTTRGHRVLNLESSCILQLWGRRILDITLRITFADAASVPRMVRLEHAPSPTAAFERLGEIMLQRKSLKQLRHLFRLGKSLEVQRFLRITLVAHMADEHSGAHRVSHMLLTSGQGPQRTLSALSNATNVRASAASGQASVNHSKLQEAPAADSAASASPEAPAPKPAAVEASLADRSTPAMPPVAAECVPTAPTAAAAAAVPTVPDDGCSAQPEALSGPAPMLPAPERGASPASSSGSGSIAGDQQPEAFPAVEKSWQELPRHMEEAGMWAATADVDLDFELLATEFGGGQVQQQQQQAPVEQQQQRQQIYKSSTRSAVSQRTSSSAVSQSTSSSSAASAPVMLLSMQRCSDVDAVLDQLRLSPKQAKESLLELLRCSPSARTRAGLTDKQVDQLLTCLPSDDERRLLAAFAGRPEQLSKGEQFMLQMVQVAAVPEQVEALRFASQATGRMEAAHQAVTVLTAACAEVVQSDVLCTLLKVSQLAGNFLNAGNQNGAVAGFQIDALLKLKDVRSSRTRSRTLLHFVAREVAKQHPGSTCLNTALPSAAAAAQLDLAAARADLLELVAGTRRVEERLLSALEQADAAGLVDATAAVQLAAFQADAERLTAMLGELADAHAAFRHLGTFINGQHATLASPSAFFGVLCAFAMELEVAHLENAEVDAGASKPSGPSKDIGVRRQSEGASPSASTAASLDLSRRRPRQSSSGQENASSEGQQLSKADKGALLGRLKQANLERRQSMSTADSAGAARPQKQHSPQPCMSRAAMANIGGSRRSGGASSRSSSERDASSPPAETRVDAAALLAQASQGAGQCGGKLSTPVTSLLAESVRIMSSMDGGQGGFGSAIGSQGAASSGAAAAPAACGQDTAATPDGDVRSTSVSRSEEAEQDACYSTPRGAVSQRWLDQQQEQQPAPVAALGDQGPGGQVRYAGTASADEDEVPAPVADVPAAVPSERLAVSNSGSINAHGSQGAALSQLRQRSLQHLSPTSTPLSSMGRQSSYCSSVYSSDCDGTTPRSSLRARGLPLQRSTSPLGLGAAVAEAEARAGGGGAAVAPQPQADAGTMQPSPSDHTTFGQADASVEVPPMVDSMLPVQGAPAPVTLSAAAAGPGKKPEAEEQAALPPAGKTFGAMHSRASSFDISFYAPFSMHQEGPSAFAASGSQAPQGLAASFAYESEPDSSWGPLAAQQQLQARSLRHASADATVLAGAAAGLRAGKSVSLSLPASPRCNADEPSAGHRPPPLDFRGLTDRLQGLPVHRRSAAAAQRNTGGDPQHYGQQQQQPKGPASPVLKALLASVPTMKQTHADLASDDLADLAGFSSDHEVEWQQLQRIEMQDAACQQQQAAEREARELLLALHPVYGGQQVAGATSYSQLAALQQQLAEMGLEGDEAAQQAALQALPSPINSACSDLDGAMARLLVSAGNTPTGPLGLGVRGGPADMFGAGQALRTSVPGARPQGQHMALLEPVMPAPLGEGVRASQAMAAHVAPAALRMSVEGPRMALHHATTAPAATLTDEAEQWAAATAAAAATGEQAGRQGSHTEQQLGVAGGYASSSMAAAGASWEADAGDVPSRRRGMRKYLTHKRS